MPKQLENQPVVGEDGELIQPDRTIDEAAYAEYVATHVHRDPLWFRLREHVKEWGCVYIFVIPLAVSFVAMFIFLGGADDATNLLGLLVLISIIVVVYWILLRDDRQ